MKKIVLYVCVGAMLLGLTACGGDDQANNGTEQSTQPSVEATVESGAEESKSESEATTESTPAEEGTVMDVTNGWSEEMETIKAAIIDAVGEEGYIPNTMPLDQEMLEMSTGVTADMYEDYLAEMPMMSAHVDTLLIIKAKDDKVEDVEAALSAYREAKVSDTMQYPANVGKIQASRIERIGNYVCFVQLGGDTMAAAESGDEAVIEQCQHANELVIEVINQNVEH